MNSKKINGVSPCRVSALPLAPIRADAYRDIVILLSALLLTLAITMPLRAQDAPSYEPGTRVISNSVEHSVPRPMPVFTDSPRAEQGAARDESAPSVVRPESSSDDFDNNTPTEWWIYTGQTPANVASTISSDRARIIDIEVDASSPYSFTVTYVHNTGAYAKAWWWYYGQTAAEVSAKLTANKARPISVKAYDIGGGNIRFAVAMIANTGADARASWWYYGQTPAEITTKLTTNKARLITLDSYSTAGETRYTAIMLADAGVEKTGWWWWYNVTGATISSKIESEKSRVIYLASAGNGKFNAVMESCASGCSEWWWYYGVGGEQLLNLAGQNGARPVNLSMYPCGASSCFAAAMINNSNAVTTRVGNLIRNGGIRGVEGLYLEQVNGPSPSVLANLEDGVVYEPASSIKVLANLYAMTKVEAGAIKLTTPITHYINGPESCPYPPTIAGTEPLGTAIREMMWHSDNARTEEVTNHFTDARINAYAQSIGLTNTAFNEIVGCVGTTPDMFSLDDAGMLYAGVANQDFLNAKNRGIFYSNMAGRAQYESEGYDWTGVWDNDIPNIINEVAPAGTTAAEKAAYMADMNVAYKAGNYVICTNNSCTDVVEDISISGWFQLPVCSASGTTYAEYVWGIMFANEPYDGWTSSTDTQTDKNFTTAKSELMREQIAAGMASCNGKSLDVMTYSPADLAFSSTNVGKTTPSKSVTITNNQLTTVTGLTISIFGDFTETSTCGSSLKSGKSCNISVDFTPTATGERTGAVIVTDDGTGQPQTIQLTGTGQ
jgi:hypothetical protein